MSMPRLLPVTVAALVLGTASLAVAQMPPPPPPATPTYGQPPQVLLLSPVSIAQMQPYNVVAVKGTVTEIFGNKFILQDDTGRTLVELGPLGEDGAAVTRGEVVTVQGSFERGFIHALLVSHADGRNQAFGPLAPPPPLERGPGRRPLPPVR